MSKNNNEESKQIDTTAKKGKGEECGGQGVVVRQEANTAVKRGEYGEDNEDEELRDSFC